MSKYAPLGEFLRSQKNESVPLKFRDIERLTGVKLPPSARRREWWSNNPNNSVLTKVWLKAGFRSEQVDMVRQKLVFRRAAPQASEAQPMLDIAAESEIKNRHPLFGLLKDFTHVAPGVDLTEPADPEWGKIYD